jgi:hypothetical protein
VNQLGGEPLGLRGDPGEIGMTSEVRSPRPGAAVERRHLRAWRGEFAVGVGHNPEHRPPLQSHDPVNFLESTQPIRPWRHGHLLQPVAGRFPLRMARLHRT